MQNLVIFYQGTTELETKFVQKNVSSNKVIKNTQIINFIKYWTTFKTSLFFRRPFNSINEAFFWFFDKIDWVVFAFSSYNGEYLLNHSLHCIKHFVCFIFTLYWKKKSTEFWTLFLCSLWSIWTSLMNSWILSLRIGNFQKKTLVQSLKYWVKIS